MNPRPNVLVIKIVFMYVACLDLRSFTTGIVVYGLFDLYMRMADTPGVGGFHPRYVTLNQLGSMATVHPFVINACVSSLKSIDSRGSRDQPGSSGKHGPGLYSDHSDPRSNIKQFFFIGKLRPDATGRLSVHDTTASVQVCYASLTVAVSLECALGVQYRK